MDEDKKKELAEFDQRWNFEKTVQVPTTQDLDWQKVRAVFNDLQSDQGDLYMTIANLETPQGFDTLRQWYRNRKQNGEEVTFHHSQVYNFYVKLANEFNVSVGKAVFKVLYEKDELRDYFDLGKTVNVSMNNVDLMDTEESSVSRDELEEFIEDE